MVGTVHSLRWMVVVGWNQFNTHVDVDDDGDDDEDEVIHDYDHGAYLIIVIFFTLTKLLENKIYT